MPRNQGSNKPKRYLVNSKQYNSYEEIKEDYPELGSKQTLQRMKAGCTPLAYPDMEFIVLRDITIENAMKIIKHLTDEEKREIIEKIKG